LPPQLTTTGPQAAPGLLAVHYSPRTPLTLVTGATSAARDRLLDEVQSALASSGRIGLLALDEDLPLLNVRFGPSDSRLGLANGRVVVEVVGSYSDPARSAAHLYHAIRTLDALDLSQLFVRELADASSGLGRALADRLRRASRHIVDTEH
jgi:hypothetical protein